jgi:hypothetical protein
MKLLKTAYFPCFCLHSGRLGCKVALYRTLPAGWGSSRPVQSLCPAPPARCRRPLLAGTAAYQVVYVSPADPLTFSDFIHSQKRDPATGLRDNTMQWDLWSLSPESLHQPR